MAADECIISSGVLETQAVSDRLDLNGQMRPGGGGGPGDRTRSGSLKVPLAELGGRKPISPPYCSFP